MHDAVKAAGLIFFGALAGVLALLGGLWYAAGCPPLDDDDEDEYGA